MLSTNVYMLKPRYFLFLECYKVVSLLNVYYEIFWVFNITISRFICYCMQLQSVHSFSWLYGSPLYRLYYTSFILLSVNFGVVSWLNVLSVDYAFCCVIVGRQQGQGIDYPPLKRREKQEEQSGMKDICEIRRRVGN